LSRNSTKPVAGFIICGWNFLTAPFSKFPREDSEYVEFVKVVEHIVKELGLHVCLMSHSNGFELSPGFRLTHGRDFPITEKLYSLISDDVKEGVSLMGGIYTPAETKAIIRCFDLLVSGRVHGAIAALSQSIPTVIIDYGHEPKAHKLQGFAEIMDMAEYVCDPALAEDMIDKVSSCWANREEIRQRLVMRNKGVQVLAKKNFEVLKGLVRK
jgi:colanic acid/amylovoran biosynthesis protein